MSARNARFSQPVMLEFTHIAGALDLGGAVATRIVLTGAIVEDDLLVGDDHSQLQWQCAGLLPAQPSNGKTLSGITWPLGDPSWRTASCRAGANQQIPAMVLRNTHVGALQDNANSWPPELDLEGFKYDRLGGLGGNGTADMRKRSPEQWRDWLDRDRTFSTQPYTQLASVLVASGHRDSAENVQFDRWERERQEVRKPGIWPGWLWIWLTALRYVAVYGIGLYSFQVLYWVGGLTMLGTLDTVVRTEGPPSRHSVANWR